MCDNCRKGLQVVESDRSREALIVVKFIQRCQDYQNRVTAKQVTELLRGKKPKKNFLRQDILEEYQGRLKTMKESDIKRLIVQLLIMRVLKERFETQSIRGTSVKNIIVFITVSPSRPALLKALENGKLPVLLSDGVKYSEKCEIEKVPEERRPLDVG